jgi:lipid-A-disaccharide synthase
VSVLLVSAGEQSGDKAAAQVLLHLGTAAFGLGGDACARHGMELTTHLRDLTGMGTYEVASKLPQIVRARSRIMAEVRARKPWAALLVNYTGFNSSLLSFLKKEQIPVLWYGAPQIWAWGRFRGKRIAKGVSKMAVMLPFEEQVWQELGTEARYVGHPATTAARVPRGVLRDALGLAPRAKAVAILPGSRPHEVRSLLPALLEGYERVRRPTASIEARVLVAPSLDSVTRTWVMEKAAAARVPVANMDADDGAGAFLAAFDATLCASGTASLEAALARAIPVVTYKVSALTEALARALLTVKHIALPNILLGERVFPELVQRGVTGRAVAAELMMVLEERDRFLVACDRVEATLGSSHAPAKAVFEMLEPWRKSPTKRSPTERSAQER